MVTQPCIWLWSLSDLAPTKTNWSWGDSHKMVSVWVLWMQRGKLRSTTPWSKTLKLWRKSYAPSCRFILIWALVSVATRLQGRWSGPNLNTISLKMQPLTSMKQNNAALKKSLRWSKNWTTCLWTRNLPMKSSTKCTTIQRLNSLGMPTWRRLT